MAAFLRHEWEDLIAVGKLQELLVFQQLLSIDSGDSEHLERDRGKEILDNLVCPFPFVRAGCFGVASSAFHLHKFLLLVAN